MRMLKVLFLAMLLMAMMAIASQALPPIGPPECGIIGPNSICENDNDVLYFSEFESYTYSWLVTGAAVIDGNDNDEFVLVDPNGTGGFTVLLVVCNEDGKCSDCGLEGTVEKCVDPCIPNCSFGQGFYGNEGGKACGGIKTPYLIDDLLVANGPIVIGRPGHSITLDSSTCIIDLLPAGGKPAVLPPGDYECGNIPSSILKKSGRKEYRFNNVLIGQMIALSLNLRLDDMGCEENIGDLDSWTLPEMFCTVDRDGDVKTNTIPEPFVGLTVGELLHLGNEALAGVDDVVSLNEINKAVTAINEAFDGCAELIECPSG